MGTIFAFSLCHAPEVQCLLEGNTYMCLVPQFLHLVPWFLWLPPQGIPLDHLPLTVRRAYVPGSHGTVTVEEQFLAGYHTQGTAQTA